MWTHNKKIVDKLQIKKFIKSNCKTYVLAQTVQDYAQLYLDQTSIGTSLEKHKNLATQKRESDAQPTSTETINLTEHCYNKNPAPQKKGSDA